jgi:hypothetical protein
MPDLKRCLANAGYSKSPELLEACKRGDEKTRRQISSSTMLSRAYDFAGKVPEVSEMFVRFANEYNNEDHELDRECVMKVNAESCEILNAQGLRDSIDLLNGAQNREDVHKRLKLFGLDGDLDSLCDVHVYDDRETFCRKMPLSWSGRQPLCFPDSRDTCESQGLRQ